jgi:hypothetical protein
MKQIQVPSDTDTVKLTDIKLLFHCSKCGHDWACYLAKLSPMSSVCLWCLKEKFEHGQQ